MKWKATIRQALIRREQAAYEAERRGLTPSYNAWYRAHEELLLSQLAEEDHSAGERLSIKTVRYSHLRNYLLSGEALPDLVVACDDEGQLTPCALTLIRDFFAENPAIGLVYGDEDRVDADGLFRDPWMKSDWAPDTFLSTFYFGSIFAFRSSELGLINPASRKASDYEARSVLEEDSREELDARRSDLDDGMSSWIYGKLCMKLAQAAGGFSRRTVTETAAEGEDAPLLTGGSFPIGHIPEILFHRDERPVLWNSPLIRDSLTGRYSSESAATRLISIIIPSRDNPEVLGRCIETIGQYTQASPYELIIVDNGSTDENRRLVEELLARHNEAGASLYLYEKAEFNFSRMCNLGASRANGELLLFLNDDIEIRKPGWLSYLSEKAKLPYVGAVGMKLLYPNSDIIQHAGVVNLRVGPVHKLQYENNAEEIYFGFNKGVRNVMAVTGACLMVRAELFHEVGGFDEDRFAVAFNDIDLCYRIYEKGYYNVVRNNMYLYHHESLSRGDDRKDRVKSLRLSKELETLLRAHPGLYGVDPFYAKYMTQNPVVTKFRIDYDEELLRSLSHQTMVPSRRRKKLPEKWTNPVLRLGVEYANSLDEWYLGPFATGTKKGYYVKGYSFVIGADNALYERTILLRQSSAENELWELPVRAMYREDIRDQLKDQIHVDLTGFIACFEAGILPEGDYTVGMLAKDRSSRQRIVNWSDVILKVRG
ncbi:glycosyltransferase family 2 protein [Lachnoclostridium sp. Marseille-P6806]|uniref:glycosyltransferase family 2 protein n=1 Tax=Lachnoclostridium sp. Marseille-P6806 TaxID=2364793 RepID=UPI001F5E8B22|nr:glycosyltransferase [Lachnoclostridium sp. Marseille-P6806]